MSSKCWPQGAALMNVSSECWPQGAALMNVSSKQIHQLLASRCSCNECV